MVKTNVRVCKTGRANHDQHQQATRGVFELEILRSQRPLAAPAEKMTLVQCARAGAVQERLC